MNKKIEKNINKITQGCYCPTKTDIVRIYNSISHDNPQNEISGIDIIYLTINKRHTYWIIIELSLPNICDLKLLPNIDGTWITIQDDVGTSMTIKLSDLSDFYEKAESEVNNE